jgi:hypothetical protein
VIRKTEKHDRNPLIGNEVNQMTSSLWKDAKAFANPKHMHGSQSVQFDTNTFPKRQDPFKQKPHDRSHSNPRSLSKLRKIKHPKMLHPSQTIEEPVSQTSELMRSASQPFMAQ